MGKQGYSCNVLDLSTGWKGVISLTPYLGKSLRQPLTERVPELIYTLQRTEKVLLLPGFEPLLSSW
jgi:hypothetical protein